MLKVSLGLGALQFDKKPEAPDRARDILGLLVRRRRGSIIRFDSGDTPLFARPPIRQRRAFDQDCD